MSLPVLKLPSVFHDLEHYALYISGDNAEAAERFLDAAEEAFETIGKTPFIGRARSFSSRRLKDLRSWRIPGFNNYLVFYRVTENCVHIVRVIHGAMDLERELS